MNDQNRPPIKDITEPGQYTEGQRVDLIIKAETDLGFKAIVDGEFWGVLYFDEVFVRLEPDQRIDGFVQKVRPDGKLDLTLNDPKKAGHRASNEIGNKILDLLKEEGGFFAITDKTPPEEIYELFGVSKKKFKMALGGLYKQRLITVSDDGIRLATSKKT